MSNELLPCPFCGCHGVTMASDPSNPKRHAIKCEDCPGMADFHSSTAEQAIAAWNRRPTPEQSGENEEHLGLQKAWNILTAMVSPGVLQGNGCDETAKRNGIILAANAIAAAMDRSALGREA